MHPEKRITVGDTPVERQRILKDGGMVLNLANSHPEGPVAPNSEEAMKKAREVRAFFENKNKRTTSIWKERPFR